jgi:hypothetical protein
MYNLKISTATELSKNFSVFFSPRQVVWLKGPLTNVSMIHKTLVYSPFSHLTGLLARENLVEDKVNYCRSPLYQPSVVHNTLYTKVCDLVYTVLCTTLG